MIILRCRHLLLSAWVCRFWMTTHPSTHAEHVCFSSVLSRIVLPCAATEPFLPMLTAVRYLQVQVEEEKFQQMQATLHQYESAYQQAATQYNSLQEQYQQVRTKSALCGGESELFRVCFLFCLFVLCCTSVCMVCRLSWSWRNTRTAMRKSRRRDKLSPARMNFKRKINKLKR